MRRPGGHGRRTLAPAAGAAAVLLLFAGAVSASSRVEATATTTTCTCSKTGPYVSPAAGTAVSGAQTSSAHGTYTATWSNGNVTVRKGTATVLTTQGTAGGFSPDEHAFVTESLAGGVLSVRLYNLTAPSPGNEIFAATPTVVSSTIAFSPSGHYLLLGYTTASQTFLQVADTTVDSQADQHAFSSGGLSTSGAPGSEGDTFGSLIYGFGPDDSRFVYAYLSSPSQAAWRWVDLKNAPQTIHSDATSGSSAYAQFSPCGDVLAIVNGFGGGTVTINLFDSSSGSAVGQQWSGQASTKPVLKTTAASHIATVNGVDRTLAPNACTPPDGGGGGGGGSTVPATGDFVDPKPGTLVSGQQPKSARGTYTASWSGGNVTVSKGGVAVLTTQGTAGGFSPDEHAFVAETLTGSTSSIRLFNLKGPDPGTATWNGGATVTSEQLVFSPSSHYLLHAYTTTGNQVHFELVDATATGTTTAVYTTSVSTATGAPTGATGTAFGTVSYGFGPDDSRFVFGYATSSDLVDWTWADLSSPPVQSRAVQNLVATSSYVRFTPCGNALAVVSVASNGVATVALDDSSAGTNLGSATGSTAGQAIALEAETAGFTATIGGTKHTLAANTCASSGGGTSGGPQASFTAPTGVVSGVAAQFTDTSTGTISAWSWDFGDGSGGSNVQSPTHAFAAAGTYTVRLTVTDGGGAASSASHDVTVAAGAPQPTSFGSAWGFRAGAQPWSVAIGDLDGDGKADVAASNLHSDTVSVFRGDGAGGLAPKTDYGTGKNPGAVAIADLNGDGSNDLVVSSGGAGSVTVLLADGHGGFGAKQTYATGESPFADKQLYGILNQSLAVADLNGDGKVDVAVANGGSNTVSILLGDGSGALGTHTDVPAGVRPESVAIGDLNGDGKADLAVAAAGSDSVSVLLGNGSGGFGPFHSFAAGPEPSSVAIGDFDGDGNADVAVAAYTGALVSVLLGDGSGGLAAKTDYAVGSHPESVAVADLDGDGDQDLAVANGASDSVSVLPGDGDGSFGAKVDLGTGKGPLWVAAGDLDGDGAPDLATADSTSDTVSVLLDLGAAGGGLHARFTATPSSSPGSLQVDADASDSTGSGLSYAWSFGDGSDGSGVHVQHAYTAAGAYTITLTVTADGGGTVQVTHSVTVPAAPPPAAGPGALTQLPSPYDCIAQDGTEGCGTTTAAGIDDADWVAASPDGKNVYVASFGGDSVAAFARDDDGSLTQLPGAAACVGAFEGRGCATVALGLSEATSVAVSPDGRNVYATGDRDETVVALTRNADGSLSPLQCVQNVNASFDRCTTKITGLDNPYDVTVSPDGKNVYVAAGGGGGTDGAIVEFARATDGTLTQLAAPNDCIEEQGNGTPICGASDGEGLLAVTALAVSPDGANLYAVSDTHYVSGDDAPGAVTSFTRDPDTGALTQLGCTGEPAPTDECQTVTAAGLSDLVNVAISPDGKNVYTASDDANGAIAEFHREDDGSLTALGCAGGGSPCTMLAPGLASVFGLAVSPDGQNVYAAAAGSFTPQVAPGVVALSRAADGRLTAVGGAGGCIEQEGESGAVCANTSGHGLADALGVAVSPDGANVYTAASGGAVAAFSRDATQADVTPPVGVFDAYDVNGGTLDVDAPGLLANDEAETTVEEVVDGPYRGTLTGPSADGSFGYRADPGFTGDDFFSYRIVDADGVESLAITVALHVLSASPGTTLYVDDAWTGLSPGVDPDGDGPATAFGTDAYGTIADAIGAAGAGSTIRVAAGTYDETAAGVLRIRQTGLQLLGAGRDLTHVTLSGLFLVASDVTVAGLDLHGTGGYDLEHTLVGITDFAAGATVRDCTISEERYALDVGAGGASIVGNEIHDVVRGIDVALGADGTTIAGNDITGTLDGGSAIEIDALGASNTRITGNTLSGNSGWAIVQRNSHGSSPGTVVHGNDIAGNALGGVQNLASEALDATGNWWGDASGPAGDGPGTGDAVDGASFDPWLRCPIAQTLCPVANQPPVASFEATMSGSAASVDASASTDPDGTVASYAWDFGDGGTATGATAAHTYLAAGTFTIRLTVTDDAGATASATHDVTVPPAGPNRAPTAFFDFPSNDDPATRTISLDSRGSSDPDGTIAAYAWDWGDGSAGSGAEATHTYEADGDFTVTLTVTDDAGATGSFSRLLHVPVRLADSSHSSATIAPASVPADGVTAATVTVTMRDEQGQPISGLDVRLLRSSGHATISPAGPVQTDADGVATFSVTSDTVGTAVLEADDSSDGLVVDVVDVEFTDTGAGGGNEPPTASFAATPSSDPGSLQVSVDGSGSSDGDGSIASYAWDFGDGSSGSGATASHTYAAAGTYTIALTVTDDDGATATVSHEATVPATAANRPPAASFSSSADGLEVSLDASGSSDDDGSIASYAWEFGDGSTGDGETASHAYDEAGTYTVRLTVTDDGGATATVEHEVTVAAPAENGAPQASFTATPSDEAGSLEVAVDASGSSDADGSIASYAWDFGDGASGSGKTASHAYAAAGTYTVALTVTDDDGATATATHDVTVPATAESESPVASFEAEPSEEPGSFEVAFDASGSTGSISSYSWDFGDGASGSGATTSHTYDHAGTYAVALTVTGDGGATATVSHDVGVPANAKPHEPVHPKPPAPRQPVVLPPSAAFSVAPASGDTTATWTFDASSSSRASSYAWDFGDGGSASGATASHVFARPGTYTVRLTARGAGGSASAEHSVTVAPRPPRAAFYYQPARPVPGRPMGFVADTIPVAGGAPLASYAWDFGDGTTASGARAGHIYLSSGSFRVTLTVTDTAGQTATAAVAVAVAAADAPSAMFVYEPTPVGVDADTTFGGIAIRRVGTWAATRLVGWSWSFGDGTTATGQQVHHVFAREGSYRVQLTVTDASGAAGTVASTVVVKTNVVAVDETVSVGDTATLVPPKSISVVEPIVVSDAPGVVPPAILAVTENVGVSDVPGVVPPAVVAVDESWGFTDSTTTAVHH